jgi:two-component system chemotaxis sensor kinase CheA
MTRFSDERGAELRELFFETAQEQLQGLNEDALKLEASPNDAEAARSLRRTVHTLKGDSAACGFSELSDLAHLLENALAGDVTSGASFAELGFAASDAFNSMLAAYRNGSPLPDTSELKRAIQAISAPNAPPPGMPTLGTVSWSEYENLAAENARRGDKRIFHITAQVDPVCSMPIAARQLVLRALASAGEIIGARPEAGSSEHANAIEVLIATSRSETELAACCRIPTVISSVICAERGGPGAPAEASLAGQPRAALSAPAAPNAESERESSSASSPAARAEQVLRVDSERIDNIINLVGELVIAKSMMQQSVTEFVQRYPKDALHTRFSDVMGFQSRVLNDLQRSVMKVRMVPVEQLFRRFPRIVRDVAKRCHKDAQLVASGQNTDLDKSLLDAIAEPLTHIVRNAISHGLETPAERQASGKPATGKIFLDAYHQGNQLIVEVKDDGRGIEVTRLKARALKANLLTPQAAESMTHQELLEVMFRPGFSTAEEVTEISGRGVGLDVVRSVLLRLKGTVEVETVPGKGTTFRLKLPLTLSIIKALLFRVEQRLYAVPLNAVAEIARARESDLHVVDSCEVLQLRGQALPLVRMGHGRTHESGKLFVLVISLGDRKMGLLVDGLEGQEELVIKSLDDRTVATDLVNGASILGDGRVVLIVNLAAIQDRFSRRAANLEHRGLLLSESERLAHSAAAAGVSR